MTILIKNAKILPMDGADIFTSDLFIEGKYIKKIEKNISDEADQTIDASNMVLMPAFINSHSHVGMSLFRNYGEEVDLYTWLNDYIWPLEERLDNRQTYLASMISLIEMANNGIGTFADMYFFSEATIKACKEIGLRAQISRGLSVPDDDDYRLKENIYLYKKYKDYDLIDIGLGPHAIYTSNLDYLKKISDLAYKYRMPIHIHLSETKKENEDCIERFGMTPTEVFEKAGIFKHKTIAAHGIYLTDNDLDIIKENKVSVVHNPSSNLKLKSGFMNLSRLLDKGINVCLGTDSSASNNKLSILREMELAALVSKLYSSRIVTAREILEMATINGAKALGLDDKIGSIKVGKEADLILIDLSNVNHTPTNNILSSLIYSTYEKDIKCTIVNGNIVARDGKILNIDQATVSNDILKTSQRIMD
ncbi:amidohydrolase [Anaerococcus sp. NML200537]|uniref:amidohydrolase family protein n=1 Tax=Anaerococcus sp. NML200537 TaxID=2954485 RepID=UPI002237FBA7|nr:amidohydrolase [Anaerococcus sp. NML200537]MCW6701230.1 amidohydrolase [Anaerococcus sp. NML200537]